MKYGAQPNDRVGPAPVGDITWRATHKPSSKSCLVRAHAWVEARALACAHFHCERHELTVVAE